MRRCGSFCSPITSRTVSSDPSIPIFAFLRLIWVQQTLRHHNRNKSELTRAACLDRRCSHSSWYSSRLYQKKDLLVIAACLAASTVRICARKSSISSVNGARFPFSLLLWCFSVPEALKTGSISGEVRPMKAIPVRSYCCRDARRPIPRSRSNWRREISRLIQYPRFWQKQTVHRLLP
jgi:hypothetical protein